MKILNLFAGIGGNRHLWGDKHEVTAIEQDDEIAQIYHRRHNKDTVIIADAYEYCLWYYDKFDFIWASPPCPTHSITNNFLHSQGVRRYPDMKLWKLIIFLKYYTHYNKNNIDWVVENVKTYYEPIIEPSFILGRHYFWSNIHIPRKHYEYSPITITNVKSATRRDNWQYLQELEDYLGIKLADNVTGEKRRKLLRNCVKPELGKYILDYIIEGPKKIMDDMEL
jgi:DNA (cytosine-5)-methyltransferase 1